MNSPLILLIDDDASFLEVLSVKLSAEGFRTETAHSGAEGILRAQALGPDLILLDMKMPGIEGADVLHTLRADPATRNLRILFLSGLVPSDEKQYAIDEQFAKNEGALGCVRKTDNLSDIVAKIRNHLDGIPAPESAKKP